MKVPNNCAKKISAAVSATEIYRYWFGEELDVIHHTHHRTEQEGGLFYTFLKSLCWDSVLQLQ